MAEVSSAESNLGLVQAVALQEDPVVEGFSLGLWLAFDRLVQPAVGTFSVGVSETNFKGQTLELEGALLSVATKARTAYCHQLDAICKRLDHLVLQVDVNHTNSPFEPECVIRSFIEAVSAERALPPKAKAVLYATFKSHVLRKLGSGYLEVNRILAQARILPELTAKQPGSQRAGVSPGLSEVPQSKTRSQSEPRSAQPEVATPEVTRSPPGRQVQLIHSVGVSKTTARLLLPRQNGQSVADNTSTGRPAVVVEGIPLPSFAADEVIALCAALFQEIQSDQELIKAVKVKLGRLELPFTKFALQESPIFLLDAEHPARCLLELLWSLGRSLSNSRQPAFLGMAEVVSDLERQPTLLEQDFAKAYRYILPFREHY